MHLTLQLITLLVLVGVPATAGTVLYSSIVSPDSWVYQGGSVANTNNYKDGGVHGAPGPIAGAWPSIRRDRLWSLLAHQSSSPQA